MSEPQFRNITLTDFSAFILGCVLVQLPVYQLYVSLTIASWVFVSLIAGIVAGNRYRFSLELLLPVGLYALYAIGLLWADNESEAHFEMEQKMGLVFIPLLVMYLKYNLRQIRMMVIIFMIGCLFSVIELGLYAVLNYTESRSLTTFLYIQLSPRIHPSYLSFYMNISILILIVDYVYGKLRLFSKRWVYVVLIAVFALFSLLLFSKNGMITTLMLIISLMIYWLRNGRWKLVLLTVLVAMSVSVGLYKKSEYVQLRVAEFVNGLNPPKEKQFLYSTTFRQVLWNEAYELYMEQPLLGYGTGDTQDVLNRQYEKKNIVQAANLNANTHNQYLQTGLAVGIFGVLALFVMLLNPLRNFRKQHYYFAGFSLITFVFFITESVLQTQAGVIGFISFYAILYTLIQAIDNNETSHTNTVLST